MKESSGSKWDEAVQRQEQSVRRRADVMLGDSSHDWLRTPMMQRTLVVAYTAVAVTMVVFWFRTWEVPAIAMMAVWALLLLALRISVRSQADLPDYVLDERQRRERDRVYLDAFRVVAAGVFFAAMVLLVVVVGRESGDDSAVTIGYGAATGTVWGVAALVFGAPSAALALRQAGR
jgi:hypothetical protein